MGMKNLMQPTRNPYLMGSDAELGRQTQYFAKETIDFIQSLGKYADNHYKIQIQKWGESAPEVVECRIEDSFDEQANLKRGDDWKDILLYGQDQNITIGMLAWFENNTWLGFNTRNIASLTSSVTVRRCDNVLNFVDEFGNVTPVPFVFDKYTVLNSTTIEKPSQPISLINGYKNAWVQYNEYTATMRTNDRFIINGQAWSVRGIDKVSRQSTTDRDSVRLMAFVLMRTEERDDDDLVNDIADASAYVWTVVPDAISVTDVIGKTGNVGAELFHGNVKNDEYGIVYATSDESIVTVDANGNYEIVGEGTATITCAFEKNENIYATVEITGTASAENNYHVVLSPEIESLAQYETATITITLYNGTEALAFVPSSIKFTGVPQKYYAADIDGNTVTLYVKAPYVKAKLTMEIWFEESGILVQAFRQIALTSAI